MLNFASVTILARMLAPQDFGLVAMVTAATSFIALFGDAGLSSATIQRSDLRHAEVNTLFWMNALLGLLLAGICAGVAPAAAWFYKEPRLVAIMTALSAAFILSGFTVQHQALLRRQMSFAALAGSELAAQLSGFLAAVAAASLGLRYWALVVRALVAPLVQMVAVLLLCPWRPSRPRFSKDAIGMLRFGGYLTAFSAINFLPRNLDNVLIGRYWGAAALGFYSRAYALLLMPVLQINAPVTAVAVPTLSRLQHDPVLYRGYYLRGLSIVTFLAAPLAATTVALAEEIVLVVLGPNWRPSIDIFRYLGISALAQPLGATVGWLYVSSGRGRRMFGVGSLGAVWLCSSFVVGLPYGAKGVALAYGVAILLWVVPVVWFATSGTEITLSSISRVIWRQLVSACIAGALCYALAAALRSHSVTSAVILALGLGTAAIVYLLVDVIVLRDNWHRYAELLKALKKTRQ